MGLARTCDMQLVDAQPNCRCYKVGSQLQPASWVGGQQAVQVVAEAQQDGRHRQQSAPVPQEPVKAFQWQADLLFSQLGMRLDLCWQQLVVRSHPECACTNQTARRGRGPACQVALTFKEECAQQYGYRPG